MSSPTQPQRRIIRKNFSSRMSPVIIRTTTIYMCSETLQVSAYPQNVLFPIQHYTGRTLSFMVWEANGYHE
ncbi:hypothetical protein TNCV_4150101 [Trichonephila clavipes]|uniref:Uncharacterized protein n=1 Tax=Trichonephila clavipes TaxID=2585209 RepID=A0A8X7BFE1_TRICX|nr:hypothetical protein TNCV_4150101 [Trichonephila clavipes]